MYNPYFAYLMNLQQPQQASQTHQCHHCPRVPVKPVCHCCYQSVKTPTTHTPYRVDSHFDVNQLLSLFNQVQPVTKPYDLYYNLFLQILNLISMVHQDKNVKLAQALCDYFDVRVEPTHIKVEQTVKPEPVEKKEEIKVDTQQILNQVYANIMGQPLPAQVAEESKVNTQQMLNQMYTSITGQTLPTQVSEAVASVVSNNSKKLNVGQINGVMDEVLKMLMKTPEVKDLKEHKEEADSILNEFLKTDH